MNRRPVPRALRIAARIEQPHDAVEPGAAVEPVAADRPKPSPRPRPRPVPDVEPEPTPKRSVDAQLIGLILAAAVFVALAGTFSWLDHRATASEQAGREALAASTRAAETILSYDHRKIDADIAAASKLATGQFKKDYADTSKTVKPIALEYKAVVKATVQSGSVVSADPDRVVTLLFVNQSTQSTRVRGTQIDQARVRITMERAGDTWLAAKIDAL
jgi:Mce-associated membrane protein